MNVKVNIWNSRMFLWWIIIIVIACVVYATGISHESIWYDEAYSSAMAGHSFGEIIRLTTYDNHPPLYYLLLSLARAVLGNSEWALRALSVLGAVGLVALGAGPVRRIFGNRTAFIYAGVVICTPAILIYAHEARMYTLAIFAVTAGVLYGYLAVQSNQTGDWVCFGLGTLAAAYLHYYGLIAAFFMHVWVFFWILLKKREQMKASLVTGTLVLAGYLPWLVVFVKQTMMIHKGFWLGPPSWQAVQLAFLQPFAFREFYPTILPTAEPALLISSALIVYGLVITGRKKTRQELSLSLFLLVVYLGTLITTILVSLFLMPIFYSRYMLVCLGLFLLLISLGISMLPGKYLPFAMLGIFALLNIFTIKDIYIHKFNYPMKGLAEKLNGAIQPGDLIITSDSYSLGGAMYYFPQAVHYHESNSIEAQWGDVLNIFVPPLHYGEGLQDLLSTRRSFWYISGNTGHAADIGRILHGVTGWEKTSEPITIAEPYSFVEFTAQKYAYTGQVDKPTQGILTVHITGLKPSGQLFFVLYDKGAVQDTRQPFMYDVFQVTGSYGLYKRELLGDLPRPYLYTIVHVGGTEASYTFYDLPYGDYVLEAAHDENKDNLVRVDPTTKLPQEGVHVVNLEKADLSQGIESITFDLLKFSFDKPEKTIEAEIMYPPFTEENKK